jgi:tRNA G18 (ribose-2'-O)-methylase SpoU
MPRWEGALAIIERMFNDGTKAQAILAALNTLWYDIAERAELPMGEEHFLVRSRDHSLPVGRPFPCACILDNIRSAFNCGSIMRSAEGFGVEAIYLTGISPGPENEKARKTAMGVIDNLNIQRHQSLHALIQEKKKLGYAIYALETAEGARPLFTEALRFPACVIFGNEEYGLDGDTLACVDQVLEIPMFGRKNSFNVAASAGIFFYEARRQWER